MNGSDGSGPQPHTYLIRHSGRELGPLDIVQLRQMWALGEIDSTTKFRRTDLTYWIDAEEILMDLEFQPPQEDPEIEAAVAQTDTNLPPLPAIVHAVSIGSSSLGCPHCGHSFRMTNELFGEEIGCPSCSESVVLPPRQILTESRCVCPACAEEILAAAIKCKHCGEFLDGRPANNSASSPTQIAQQTSGLPRCQTCGGSMKKKTISSGNCAGLLLALVVFCVGVAITVAFMPFGLIVGPLLCLFALFMGGKRSKVWKCVKCGSIVNRA